MSSRSAEPSWGRLVLSIAVLLFFVAVLKGWGGADRLWQWGINSYVDWRTDRKLERIERRMDRLQERLATPMPSPSR